MTGANHQKTVDIIIWLERAAMEEMKTSRSSNSEKASRLREAAAEIRTLRADKVMRRLGQPVRSYGGST